MKAWQNWSLHRRWACELILFALVAGGLGIWVYWRLQIVETQHEELSALEARLLDHRGRVLRIPDEEARRDRLELRRDELETAIPLRGSQGPADLIRVVDALQRRVEASQGAPLFVIREWRFEEILPEVPKAAGGKAASSVKAPESEIHHLRLHLKVASNYVGLMRFIAEIEEDPQLLRLVSLITSLGEESPGAGVPPGDSGEVSPLSPPHYVPSDLVIEGWWLNPAIVGVSR